jgi:hypothetical protein
MAKSREKIQQLGLWDPEVSAPDHDAVCLWAYENAEMIFRAVFPDIFDHSWRSDEICRHGQELDNQGATTLVQVFANNNPRPNPRIFKKTLEYVLRSYTGYQNKLERIVGYADLVIHTELPLITPRYKASDIKYGNDIFDGYEISWDSGQRAPRILVEAKSVLPTVGELMRQIQLYRTAFSGHIVVVSPDDKYESILAEQGITFVKHKS